MKFFCFILLSLLSVDNLIARQHFSDSKFVPWVGLDFIEKPCQGDQVTYGPFDYTKRNSIDPYHLNIVELNHFNKNVEFLIRGQTTISPYGDLDYTLRAWPNHHRALNALANYQHRMKRQKKRLPVAAECWFQRAINFSPKDATTHMLYAIYLSKSSKLKMSEKHYKLSLELDPDNIQAHYNYGLFLFDRKNYSQAKIHAKKAYDKNFQLPGLKNKLKKAGFWP